MDEFILGNGNEYLRLRQPSSEDAAFLKSIFLAARPHLQLLPLPDNAKAVLLEQQFQLKELHYRRAWPQHKSWLVLFEERSVGVVSLNFESASIHLLEITILPEYQRQGLGTILMNELQKQAASNLLRIELKVDCDNKLAKKWYKHCGFKELSNVDGHINMAWKPVSVMQ